MEGPPATTYQVDRAAIRIRRMALGLSQAQCATKAGISRPYLSQLELGLRERMKPASYLGLCKALQTHPDDHQLLANGETHRRE
ncbi:helix-turn-helix transcriptional regulator [Streptomyces sp. NPDC005953]|uniref:helix-turn-helix domain-containing protein n=1 Tax=Streptomyces sp. NPDC005953 TaxID=3156719 RepID=UPI0033D55ADD